MPSSQDVNDDDPNHSFICTTSADALDLHGARVLCAASVPGTSRIVYATDAPELICLPDARVTTDAPARGVASARYAALDVQSLPEQRLILLALIDNHGLCLYELPGLEPIRAVLSSDLHELSKSAHTFSVDSLGSDVVTESFRVALAQNDTVILLDVHPTRAKVSVLGQYTVDERLTAVAFSEMTIVASTPRLHYMLRISRGGGLAVAATVPRSERPRRSAASAAVGDGGAAVMSFFGSLFSRKDLSANVPPVLAHALPDNRWLLSVDGELITYSSFGAKLEEMENVFKSKVGMDASDIVSIGPAASLDAWPRDQPSAAMRSGSVSSLGSTATGVSHMTYIDQSSARRAEKPPTETVFSSPFVFSITATNELVTYAANGAIPGVLDRVPLSDNAPSPSKRPSVKIITSRYDQVLATVFWSSGKVISVKLVNDLEVLIERQVQENHLRLALALVPADHLDRVIALRRKLAREARAVEWHDAAMHHMQIVVNLSMRTEGVDQVDLVAEAVELRGSKGSSWHTDLVIATMWADFLFRLRRRVMRPSAADVDVLETLCYADESASRVKALLSVKHDVGLSAGEALITSQECMMREEERIEALVTLYTSLAEHGKALVLLENSELTNSFDGVVGYLSSSMRPSDDADVYFSHLKWVAHRVALEGQGRRKLEGLVYAAIADAEDIDMVMEQIMDVLVEDMDDLAIEVSDEVAPSVSRNSGTKTDKGKKSGNFDEEHHLSVTADAVAVGLLAAMAKAKAMQKQSVFDHARSLFNQRILHNTEAPYHAFTLLLALQSARYQSLGLNEERAFLLGQHGRHEAAADELAAEKSLDADEALARLVRMLPAVDRPGAAESLVSAYLRVSSQRRAMRVRDAASIIRCSGGTIEIEKVLLEGRCDVEAITLSDMWPLLKEAITSANDRMRIAECLRAMRKSEVARLREEVLTRRRRFVVVGHDRACTLCTRRIGDSVFAAYPDGSIAHLACHMSRGSR